MKKIITLSFLLILGTMNSQQKQLPFYEIGEYPSEYSSTNVVYLTSNNVVGLIFSILAESGRGK